MEIERATLVKSMWSVRFLIFLLKQNTILRVAQTCLIKKQKSRVALGTILWILASVFTPCPSKFLGFFSLRFFKHDLKCLLNPAEVVMSGQLYLVVAIMYCIIKLGWLNLNGRWCSSVYCILAKWNTKHFAVCENLIDLKIFVAAFDQCTTIPVLLFQDYLQYYWLYFNQLCVLNQ